MKNEITLNLRVYPVVIEDTRRPGMVDEIPFTFMSIGNYLILINF